MTHREVFLFGTAPGNPCLGAPSEDGTATKDALSYILARRQDPPGFCEGSVLVLSSLCDFPLW